MSGPLQTVSRAIAMLRCFDGGGSQLGLNELTKMMGLNKVNVLRLAQSLCEEGLLDKEESTGLYSISYGVISLARNLLDPGDLISRAEPILRAARDRTRETIALNLKQGDEAVIVAELESTLPVRYSLGVGYRADLRLGGAGLCILSRLSDRERDAIIHSPEVHTDDGKLITTTDLRNSLAEVQAQGFISTSGQRVSNATGYAAPFSGPGHYTPGAVSILLPSHRNNDPEHVRRIIETVRDTASALSGMLGATPDHEDRGKEGLRA